MSEWRRRVAEHFPLALLASALFFIITLVDYYFIEHDPIVGACVVIFGALLVTGIAISPSNRKRD